MGLEGSFQIDEQVEGDSYRLVLRGELDLATARALREAIARACGSDTSEVIVDIRGLEFVDSTGLRELLAGEAACRRGGSTFRITRATARVERVFQLAGVLEHLEPHRIDGERAEQATDAGHGEG